MQPGSSPRTKRPPSLVERAQAAERAAQASLEAVDSDFIDAHASLRKMVPSQDRPTAASAPRPPRHDAGRGALFAAICIELGIVVALVLAEGSALGAVGMAVLVALHGVAAAMSWFTLRARDRLARHGRASDRATDDWMRVVALGILGLGPLGLVGGGFALLIKRFHDRRGAAQDAHWLALVSPSLDATHGHKDGAQRPASTRRGPAQPDLNEALQPEDDPLIRAALEERPSVGPYADILARGTADQKQSVVMAMAAQYQPAFASLMRRAAGDRDGTVRMMAAAAIERLETRYLNRSIDLEDAWAQAPDDPMRALRLAMHYDEFANAGLVDESRAARTRERALEMFRLASDRRPDDPLIAQSVMRLLVRLHRDDEAIETFAPLVAAGAAPATLTSWLLECLYRKRRFDELRRISRSLVERDRDVATLTDDARKAATLWAQDAASRRDLQAAELFDEVEAGSHPWKVPRDGIGGARVIDVPYFRPRWAQ